MTKIMIYHENYINLGESDQIDTLSGHKGEVCLNYRISQVINRTVQACFWDNKDDTSGFMINLWLILESIGIIWKWDHLFEDKQCPMMFLSLLNPVIHRVFIHYSHFKFCFHCLKSNVWIEHSFRGNQKYRNLNLM